MMCQIPIGATRGVGAWVAVHGEHSALPAWNHFLSCATDSPCPGTGEPCELGFALVFNTTATVLDDTAWRCQWSVDMECSTIVWLGAHGVVNSSVWPAAGPTSYTSQCSAPPLVRLYSAAGFALVVVGLVIIGLSHLAYTLTRHGPKQHIQKISSSSSSTSL